LYIRYMVLELSILNYRLSVGLVVWNTCRSILYFVGIELHFYLQIHHVVMYTKF
jgi:hypothetical protein